MKMLLLKHTGIVRSIRAIIMTNNKTGSFMSIQTDGSLLTAELVDHLWLRLTAFYKFNQRRFPV